jgi:hypothetical protein
LRLRVACRRITSPLEHSGGGMVDEENLIEEKLLEFYELRKGNEDLEESNRRHKLMAAELAAKNQESLFGTLHDDVIHSLMELKKTDTQFMRRTHIRALFAFIEGCIYMIKQEAFIHQKYKREPNLTPEEMILLNKETPFLEKNGKVKKRPNYVDLLSNVRFTIECYKKTSNLNYELDVSGKSWQSFRNSLKVRDRITHPKNSSDMEISDNELKESFLTFSWFRQIVLDLFKLKVEKLKEQRPGVSVF